MIGSARLVVVFAIGVLVSWLVLSVTAPRNNSFVRANDGIVLGGYVFPEMIRHTSIFSSRHGIDSVIYEIEIRDCDARTRWDVTGSLSSQRSDSFEFIDESESPEILRYSAAYNENFLRSEAYSYRTSVSLTDERDRECILATLPQILSQRQKVFIPPAGGRVGDDAGGDGAVRR